MKTMLKSLAAIRTWMVALAVTFLSGATLAASLPEGYTEVEYVESSGAQWIDTGILGNTGLEAEMDLLILNIGNADRSVLSSRNGTDGRFYFLHLNSPTKLFYAYGKKGTEWTGELQRRYQVESVLHNGEQKLVVDGEVKVNSALTGDIQTGRNIYMFAVNENGGAGSYAAAVRFYHVVIKQNGTVLADFVPCRTAEGEYGFYDVQRKGFYGNGATGAPLTGGSAVSVSGDTLTIDETTGAAFLCDAAALARNRSLVLKSGEIALPMLDSSSVATFPAATLEGGTLGFSGGSAGPGQYRVTNALSVTGRVTLNVPQGLPEGTYRLIEAGSLSVADGAGFELATTTSVDPAERTLSVDGTGVTLTVEGAPKLPSGYTQVNYLESTGTEWIDTGVEAGHRTAVEMDFGNIKYVNQRALFGQDAWTNNRYMFDIQSNRFMFHGDNKDIKDPSGNLVPVDESAQYRVLVADDDTLYLAANGARVANVQVSRVTSAANKNLAVFGLNNATRQTGFRCYGLRISENGCLVRDFVPARNYRGELGLYDRVTGGFFGNQSSGRFIGSDEIDARLSYIQSSGSQYIDTGVLGNMGLETEVDMLFPSVPGGTTMPLAVRGVGGNDRFYPLYTYGSKIGYRHYTMSHTEMPFALTANTRYLFRSVLHNDELSFAVDGEIKKSTTSGITPINTGKNLCLFACNEYGTIGYYSSSRVFSAKISEGGKILRDFVPARSAGRPGVIDLANGGVFYPNKGSGSFTWGGIAYTVDGTTLKLHEGTLAAEDLADYTAIEKVDWYELNAGAVTAYAVPITLTKGVFALTDGEVKKVTVGGKLTIKGGAILKVDAIGTECDNLEVQSLDLSDATADNPIVIEIASAVGMDWSAGATLIANTGLDDGPCANIRIADNDELQPVVKNGNLMIQMKSAAAHWTGEIGDNDPTNPGNWQERTVPTAETIVYFSGESIPNIAIGTPFTAKSVELNVTLAGDYDWRGLNPNIPLTGKIDLNGHSLTVANLTGDYEITDTTDTSADDATPGELHVDVEGGKTIENATVTLSGALKFVKDSEGTFAVATAQAYAGGTDVKGGTLKCGENIYPGKSLTPVTVYEGAIYDIGGLCPFGNESTVLAGGTFANTLYDHAWNGDIHYYAENPNIKVIEDSAISADFTFGMIASKHGKTMLDLASKELTISIASGKSFVLDNTDVSAGTLKTTGEGTLVIDKTSCRAAEADFDLGSAKASVNVATEVKDLTMRSGTVVSGSGVISVNGVYRPLGATAPKVALKDGASFDLSTLDEALNLTGTTTTYTDNTTILIDVGERELETDEKVIAWSAKPANVGGLTFKFVGTKLDGETVNAVVQDDGIYYPDVTTIVKATWTGAAGDGDPANTENWTCENALELTVPGALPGASTVVYLNGEIAFNVPSGATFAAGSVNANASLKGDTDWSGLNPSILVSGTIDLNGHKLTVANLVGNYEVTDSSVTVYERLEYIQSNGSQWIDTGVLPTYNMKAELDMKFDGAINRDFRMFGVNINNYIRFQMYCGASSFTCRIGGADNSATLKIGAHNNRTLHTLEMDGTTAKYTCGEMVKSIALNTTPTQQASLYLFTTRTSPVDGSDISKNCSATFYGGKIWDGENLVRDFVPVKRVSDGAIGLLDLANLGTENEFYENKGTVAFTAGAMTGYILTKTGCDEEATPGEFHINVASGSIKNTAVTFTGATKVVKDGEGTLELGTIKQSNAGGWEIAEGTVKASGNLHTYTSFGQEGTTVVVREGATYDLNGQCDTRYYPFVLDGGTIANRGGNVGAGSECMGPITLTKDSYLNPAAGFPLWGKVDLGGFKLTVDVGIGKSFYLYNDGIFENGTVDIRTGGWIQFDTVTGNLRDMRTVDFTLNAALNLATSVNVRDLTVLYDQNYKSGSGTANIYGVFTPSAKNYIHNFVMQDGSTLNLAGRSGIYDVTSSVVTGNSNVLGFADGATINIVPGDKRTGQIVSWTEATKPADTVKFVADRKYGRLEVKDDGLYLHYGLLITIQ